MDKKSEVIGRGLLVLIVGVIIVGVIIVEVLIFVGYYAGLECTFKLCPMVVLDSVI